MKIEYDCILSADCQEYAKNVLKETPENRDLSVEAIISWLRENPQIRVYDDVKYIVFFLRGAKFNIEKAKRKIKRLG